MQRYTWLRYAERPSPNASRCRSSTASTIGCAVTTSTTPSLGGQLVPSGRLLVPAVALGPLVAAPGPHGGDLGLQTAAAARRRVVADEPGLQLGEHRLAAGLRRIVGGVAQVLVRQRQLGDSPPRLAVLHQKR